MGFELGSGVKYWLFSACRNKIKLTLIVKLVNLERFL
jgi:hypothetical protein